MPQPEKIKSMFSQVAPKYDKANTVLSLGVHHLWRRKFVNLSGVKSGAIILDCATGTGDLAIEFKKRVGPAGRVIGTDFCAEMLESAPDKARSLGMDIEFQLADVTELPYLDHQFDLTSISFGIRNVENPVKAISEMARVTKPNGKVMVLEFGQMQIPVVSPLYNYYSRTILPWIGGLVTGQREAYQYLQTSSAAFPCRDNFKDLMLSTGQFKDVSWIPLSGGIAYIYIGEVSRQ